MRYFANLGGRQRTIDVESLGGAQFRIAVDGKEPMLVDAERLEGHVINMLANDRSYEVDLEEDGDALNMIVEDELFRLELVDERQLRLQAAGGKSGQEGASVIKAPMPGKIVKVLVSVGQEVAQGQGIVVVEAMKMENELKAPKAGKVASILVTEGQVVDGRAQLATIE